jgi:hypothetical protein
MLGYNWAMLDLEIPMVADDSITGDDKAKINALLANNSVNRAGGLFKAGQIMANGSVVNEVIKRRAAIIEEGKANTTKKKEDKRGWIENEARKYYMTWLQGGMKVDGEGNPKLLKNAAYTIIKFLLPKVDILGTVRLGEFKTVKVCTKWIGEICCGMTWDQHMQEAVAKWERVQVEEWETIEADNARRGNGVSLFQIGSADA